MNKKTIILVFVIFGVPVLIATLLHSEWVDWRPGGTRNHGELISPVIEWPSLSVTDVAGEPVTTASLEGRWQLVYYTDRPCDEACLESLYWLRQVRLAQDRHVPEIGLLMIQEAPMSADTAEQIQSLSEAFVVVDGAHATRLAEHLPEPQQSGERFIMDPMANIMMRYQPDQEPDHIRIDLGRLLTWTQSQPGQGY
ncbi:MAG: hypothetical protein RI542_03775 [Wenzhouxiangella sp.]|nr:hypothetical protein [Wenzhouxiangella sp.]MDR9453043.1 hypothetical protein [Wenzhouxiangella sp.]